MPTHAGRFLVLCLLNLSGQPGPLKGGGRGRISPVRGFRGGHDALDVRAALKMAVVSVVSVVGADRGDLKMVAESWSGCGPQWLGDGRVVEVVS